MSRRGLAALAIVALTAIAVASARDAAAAERDAAMAATAASPTAQASDAAPADTVLGGFLDSLSTKTDEYFGKSAAKPDTAGLDSALAYFLAHPDQFPGVRRLNFALYPDFRFNRVDGPAWHGVASVGNDLRWGQLKGTLGYASGPNLWLGGGEYEKLWRYPAITWSLDVRGGRETVNLDRDREERRLRSLRVFITGSDHTNYYRRDGWELKVTRETPTTRFGFGFRDHLESPRATTASWSLFKKTLSVFDNLPATLGRARELEYEAAWRLPRLPITAEIVYQTSGQPLGSDFDYRRTQVAISGDIGLGRTLALVPQVTYGHLNGTEIPQAAFFLGGTRSLRSLPSAAEIGSRMALARLELVATQDILAAAHIPHPPAFPIQGAISLASGAVWGPDPFGGPGVPGDLWPDGPEAWLSEVGVAFLYQPGFPDPTGFIRLDYTRGLGPIEGESRFTISYSRAMNFVRPFRPR